MLDEATKMLDEAISAHEKNDHLLASALYLQLLEKNPYNPDANHNLGLLTLQVGRIEDAILFLENAINSNPNVHEYWVSLIDALIKLERYEDAKQLLLQATELGHTQTVFKDISSYLDAIAGSVSKPVVNVIEPPAKILQKVQNLLNKRQFNKVILKANKLRKDYPKSITLLEQCEAAYKGLGKLDAAIKSLRHALKIDPDAIKILNRLGLYQIDLEDFDGAVETLNKARLIDPQNGIVLYNIGLVFFKKKMYREAIAHFTHAIKRDPHFADAHVNLGLAYGEAHEIDVAIDCIEEGIRINPSNPEYHYNLAHYFKIKGDFTRAKSLLEKAINLSPYHAQAHHSLASITQYQSDNSHIRELEKLKGCSKLSNKKKALIEFALAKAYHDTGEIADAYQHYSSANQKERHNSGYSIQDDVEHFAQIKNSSDLFQKENASTSLDDNGITPIFVIGMPRSGTTLLEQILSAHSQIATAGELTDLSNFAKLAIDRNNVTSAQLNLFRDTYLKTLGQFSSGEPFVIDKLPHNFRYVSLILELFPNAKILHSQRDARAVCWSNFSHRFITGSLPYSNDIEDTVHFYNLYQDLMKFWDTKYPKKIYHLSYEKLVNDPKVHVENLLKHIAIAWEDNCLKPHRNRDVVRTSSQLQVRKKIYKGSSDKWKIFEPYLNGVFNNLNTDHLY